MRIDIALVILLLVIVGCNHSSKDTKLQQYLIQGKQLYTIHCANCHQPDGSGLGSLIPPLNNDYAQKNKTLSICAIRHGLSTPLTINKITYSAKMPENQKLTPLEIAEIMTYITNSWDQSSGITSVSEVDSLLTRCRMIL